MHITDRTRLRRRGGADESRFLTFSCRNRAHLLDGAQRKDHLVRVLRDRVAPTSIELHAWVVMSNHVHLLLTPRATPIDRWLAQLKGGFTTSLVEWPGGAFWQRGGGFDRAIWSVDEFEEKFRYIHLNPVRAGFVDNAEGYRWSSARDWFIAPRASAPRLFERPAELTHAAGPPPRPPPSRRASRMVRATRPTRRARAMSRARRPRSRPPVR